MKRLICCLDGTWNDDKDESILTNVVKLFRAIPAKDQQGTAQLSHYVVGIGTAYTGSLRFAIGSSGIEVGDRIRAGYKFLVDNYDPGDEVYLFGFSRGAFEARSLAGLINLVGLKRRDSAADVEQAWRVYTHRLSATNAPALDSFRQASHYPTRVKCVGAWDTVGNLGNPLLPHGRIGRIFNFHDLRLSDTIDVALHALSIDEKRGPFSPTLWTIPKDSTLAPHQHVEQVWFAGAHSDVGGGFRETGLSDIGLLWMAERVAANTGLAIDLAQLRQVTRPDPLAVQHSSTQGRLYQFSAAFPFVRLIRQDLSCLSSWRRAMFGSWRTCKVGRNEQVVNEAIHPSVLARFGKKVLEQADGRRRLQSYAPRNVAAALRGAGQAKM